MTEADAIAAAPGPVTVRSLVADLRALGVEAGDVLVVHSALSRLGWVAGGPQAVVLALLEAVGPTGTIVMPTQSGHLSDPAAWRNPPVPPGWIDAIRAETPAYDPHLTPTRGVGQVVECFRHHPATRRSAHPTLSFAANGPRADQVLDPHPLTPGLGEGSPLARLYDLDAGIVMLGSDHTANTSLHLAEYRATWPGKRAVTEGTAVLVDGERRWVTYEDLDLDSSDFAAIGEAVAAAGLERRGPIGAGTGRLMALRAVVDLATDWMSTHRP